MNLHHVILFVCKTFQKKTPGLRRSTSIKQFVRVAKNLFMLWKLWKRVIALVFYLTWLCLWHLKPFPVNLPYPHGHEKTLIGKIGRKWVELFSFGSFFLGKTAATLLFPFFQISVSSSSGRKIFFFNCGIHAREWITPATCMYMLHEVWKRSGHFLFT